MSDSMVILLGLGLLAVLVILLRRIIISGGIETKMKYKMMKMDGLFYLMVERKPLLGLLGTYWDHIFPYGWSSGEMMYFGTEEEAEECIRRNLLAGNDITRDYEITPKKKRSKKKTGVKHV